MSDEKPRDKGEANFTEDEIVALLRSVPGMSDEERRSIAESVTIPFPARLQNRSGESDWNMAEGEVSAALDDLSDLSEHERQLAATFVNGLRSGRGGLPPYRGKQ